MSEYLAESYDKALIEISHLRARVAELEKTCNDLEAMATGYAQDLAEQLSIVDMSAERELKLIHQVQRLKFLLGYVLETDSEEAYEMAIEELEK